MNSVHTGVCRIRHAKNLLKEKASELDIDLDEAVHSLAAFRTAFRLPPFALKTHRPKYLQDMDGIQPSAEVIKQVAAQCAFELQPMCAFLGGVVAQEVCLHKIAYYQYLFVVVTQYAIRFFQKDIQFV